MSKRTTALSQRVSGEPEFPAHSLCDDGVPAVLQNRVDLVSRRQLEGCRPWQDAFASQHKDRRYYEIVEDTLHPEFDYRYFAIRNPAGDITAIQPFFILDQDIL